MKSLIKLLGKGLLVVVGLFLFLALLGNIFFPPMTAEEQQAYWEENKAAFVAEVRGALDEGRLNKAAEILDDLKDIDNTELQTLRGDLARQRTARAAAEQAREAAARAEKAAAEAAEKAATHAAMIARAREEITHNSLEVRAGAYKILIKEYPNDSQLQQDAAAVIGAWENRQKVMARQELINDGFSKWDGSHKELVALIKPAMHNPDSFDHVETSISDQGDHLVVTMRYRGTNGFGAIVTNAVTARTALDRKVIEILDQ